MVMPRSSIDAEVKRLLRLHAEQGGDVTKCGVTISTTTVVTITPVVAETATTITTATREEDSSSWSDADPR